MGRWREAAFGLCSMRSARPVTETVERGMLRGLQWREAFAVLVVAAPVLLLAVVVVVVVVFQESPKNRIDG